MLGLYESVFDMCGSLRCDKVCTERSSSAGPGDRDSAEGVFINMLRLHRDLWEAVLSKECVLCAPLSVSLGDEVSREDMKTHILLNTKIPGEFLSLNGKSMSMVGTEVHTHAGFDEPRRVRILSMEQLQEGEKKLTVLRLSRPLVGGIKAPEESDEVDADSARKYVTILRSYPEVETIFKEMDAFIAEVNFVGENSEDGFKRILPSLEGCVLAQWQTSVEKLVHSRCFAYSFGSGTTHQMLMSQIVESYIMSGVHHTVFPFLLQSYSRENDALAEVLKHLRYHTLADLNLRPEFQCPVTAAIKEMSKLPVLKAPVDKLLCLKKVWYAMKDSVESNVARNHPNRPDLDLSADDLLQILKYVIVQSQPHTNDLLTHLYYINSFHLVSLSTSQLGFIFSNVVAAASWFKAKIDGTMSLLEKNDSDEAPAEYLEITAGICDVHHTINEQHARTYGSPGLIVGSVVLPTQVTPIDSAGSAEEKKSQSVTDATSAATNISDQASTVMIFGHSDSRYNGEFSQTQDIITERNGFEQKTTATHIACGQQYYCFVTKQGEAYTWGLSTCGRLGQGPDLDVYFAQAKPLLVLPLVSDIIVQRQQVSCGSNHMLVVSSNGEVYAWGDNRCGQLGFGDASIRGGERPDDLLFGLTTQATPKLVEALKGVSACQVACGAWHSMCLSTDGQVYTWGRGTSGRLGQFGDRAGYKGDPMKFSPGLVRCDWRSYVMQEDQSEPDPSAPRLSATPPPSFSYQWANPGGEKVVIIAAGWAHNVAITSSGAVFTWGCGGDGRLGHGGHFDVYLPLQVRALSSRHIHAVACAAGYAHTVISTRDGLVYAFGLNKFGQVGVRNSQLSSGPVRARKDAHCVRCPLPVLLPSLGNAADALARVKSVHCGDAHTVVVDTEGRVYGWGLNHCDQLAQGGTVEFVDSPTEISILSGRAHQVACGGNHTMCVL